MKSKIKYIVASSAILGTILLTGTAFAAETANNNGGHGNLRRFGFGRGMMGQGVIGTVTSISGNTITVNSKVRPGNTSTSTTYTVDATNATITKNNIASSVSAIATGDVVMVKGPINGTIIAATAIRDGLMMNRKGGTQPVMQPAFQGNGQPIVGGKVTAVSGNSITVVTNQGGITYSIDASAATIIKANATSSISNVAVGDQVVAQGVVNGTSVTASTVIDQGSQVPLNSPAEGANTRPNKGGFWRGVGGFFQRIFGFF